VVVHLFDHQMALVHANKGVTVDIFGTVTMNSSGSISAAGCTALYCYTMSGGIQMGGCAVATSAKCVTFKYAVGSTVFICEKARRGILEAIKIKKVNLISNRSTYGRIVPIYIDTFNGCWEEDELCTQTEATEASVDYWLNLRGEVNDLIDDKC